MALFTTMLPLIGICILFSLTAGQLGPAPPPPRCSDLATESGFGTFPHERYVELFYECAYGEIYNKSCGAGTIFSSLLLRCVYPQDAVVAVATCNSSTVGRSVPGTCGNEYYICSLVSDGYGYVKSNCSAGTWYNVTTGQCTASFVNDHPMCYRPTRGNTSVCHDFPSLDRNPCTYRTQISNTTWVENRPCPDGLAFNDTFCMCINLNDTCKYSNDLTNNKKPDPDCKYSIRAIPVSGSVVAYSEKLGNPPKTLDLAFKVTNGVYVGDTIQFRGDGSVYFLETNNNHLTSPVALCVTFRLTGTGTAAQVLNNRYNNYCPEPTIEMNATRSGNQYSIVAQVTGMTLFNPKNKTEITGTNTVTVSVGAENNFVQVCIIYDGRLNLRAVDKGADGRATTNQPVSAVGSTSLGASISINKCAIEVLKGGVGFFQELRIHEGCANTTRLAM